MSNTPETPRPFGWRDKVGYMLGNMANDFTFLFASLYLQVFYTDVLGIHAGVVGTMFLIARVIDAFTDTAMGRICDRTKATRNGKFKPWLLRACGAVALASFLMYQSAAAGLPMSLRIGYMFGTYLLWGSVCYTCINIPYGAMSSVISNEPDHRSALSTFRGLGSMFPQILVGVAAPLLLYTRMEDGTEVANASAFPVVALITSVLAVVGYAACYVLCTERVEITDRSRGVSVRDTLKALSGSRALIGIALVFVFYLAAQMLSQTINNYMFKDYFGNADGLAAMNAAGFVPVLLLAPFAVPLARRFGKKELAAFACLLGSAAFGALFFLKTTNMWLYIFITIGGMLGFGLFNLLVWAFVSDVIDDQEVRTGVRDDATIYAVCSFSRKLGQAVASALGGWGLSWIGYVEGSAAGQSQAVRAGIYNLATLAPALLYLAVGICLIAVYPLGKKTVRENASVLKARREK